MQGEKKITLQNLASLMLFNPLVAFSPFIHKEEPGIHRTVSTTKRKHCLCVCRAQSVNSAVYCTHAHAAKLSPVTLQVK